MKKAFDAMKAFLELVRGDGWQADPLKVMGVLSEIEKTLTEAEEIESQGRWIGDVCFIPSRDWWNAQEPALRQAGPGPRIGFDCHGCDSNNPEWNKWCMLCGESLLVVRCEGSLGCNNKLPLDRSIVKLEDVTCADCGGFACGSHMQDNVCSTCQSKATGGPAPSEVKLHRYALIQNTRVGTRSILPFTDMKDVLGDGEDSEAELLATFDTEEEARQCIYDQIIELDIVRVRLAGGKAFTPALDPYWYETSGLKRQRKYCATDDGLVFGGKVALVSRDADESLDAFVDRARKHAAYLAHKTKTAQA